MKKTVRILSAILAFATLFSATACDGDEKVKVGDDIWTVETVYAKAQELGFTGTWEEFRETMRGMDGVGIATVAVDEEGELIVTFSDGKNVKCGKVKGEACKHNYGGYTLGFAPTCESIGYNQRACRKCGDIDYKFLAPTGHDWQLLMPLEGDVSIFVCTKCNLTKADSNEGSGGGSGGGSGDVVVDDTKTILNVGAVRNGQDRVWLESIAEHFEYLCQDVSFEAGKVGVDIKLDYSADPTVFKAALQSGASTYDVVYLPERYAASIPLQLVEDLSSLFASTVTGENRTIKDKMPAEYAAYANQGMAGCLPYTQEYCGIVYNAYLFEKYQWEVPNTTDELLALGAEMAYVNVTPMIHCGTDRGAYWEPILNLWTVQYDGVEAYREYLNNDVAALNQKNGRVKAISALQSFLTDDRFMDERSWQASYSFVQAQMEFLYSPFESYRSAIAMMPNGEWMLFEMSDAVQKLENEYINASKKLDIKMMKTPVLSSIIELCPSIADDATLSKVIDAVDAGESSYTGVTQADFNRVKEARCLVETLDFGFQIAKSSTKKDVAKAFLAYLASDEGLTVAANTASVRLSLDYDYTSEQIDKFDTLRKSCFTDFSGAVTMPKEVFTKAFQNYGITTAYGLYSIQEINERLFFNQISAEAIVDAVIDSLDRTIRDA